MSNPFDASRDIFGFDWGEPSSDPRVIEFRERTEILKLAKWFEEFAKECHANLPEHMR